MISIDISGLDNLVENLEEEINNMKLESKCPKCKTTFSFSINDARNKVKVPCTGCDDTNLCLEGG